MSFTPGPWKWHWRFEDGIATGSIFAAQWSGPAYAVAMCPRYQTKERWTADAQLISAAPDLFEALQALELQALHGDVNRNEWGRDALAQARAAITKAQGQEVAPDGRASSVSGDEG